MKKLEINGKNLWKNIKNYFKFNYIYTEMTKKIFKDIHK